MLKKEICLRCHQMRKARWSWHPQQEDRWNVGHVACPFGEDSLRAPSTRGLSWVATKVVFINKEPPLECLYRLEHLLSHEGDA